MSAKVILLVEDNPDDQALTLRALRKNHLANEVVTAEDGVKALNISPARTWSPILPPWCCWI